MVLTIHAISIQPTEWINESFVMFRTHKFFFHDSISPTLHNGNLGITYLPCSSWCTTKKRHSVLKHKMSLFIYNINNVIFQKYDLSSHSWLKLIWCHSKMFMNKVVCEFHKAGSFLWNVCAFTIKVVSVSEIKLPVMSHKVCLRIPLLLIKQES